MIAAGSRFVGGAKPAFAVGVFGQQGWTCRSTTSVNGGLSLPEVLARRAASWGPSRPLRLANRLRRRAPR
eukprot:2378509-Lingulodinium_polyedra.AAC.1